MRPPLIAALGLAILGCVPATSIPLRTENAGAACMEAALLPSILSRDDVAGLGLISPGGTLIHPFWPHGWSARADGTAISLLDEHGAVIAHVGDLVTMGGGLGNDDDWYVCPTSGVEVVSTPRPSDIR